MPELGIQGPLSSAKGRLEGSPSKKEGTTDNSDSTSKMEGTQTTQTATEGRAEPTEGTSKKIEAPKKVATEESFLEEFDPTTLPAELQPAYQKLDKDFKTAFTKKTQAIAKQKDKIEAYDAFFSNPFDSLNRTAQQYGYKMVPVSQVNQQGIQQNGQGFADWQPNTWDEVFNKFSEGLMGKIEQNFMGKLQPVFDNLQRVTSDNIEKQLSEIDKDWKLYEDEMTENLKMHPTLAKDVSKLYRISVPEDVLKSKYTQVALKKFEDKATSAKVQGKSSVQSSQPIQNKKMSFQESIEWAKRTLAEQGK
jgi:hypothetical protein